MIFNEFFYPNKQVPNNQLFIRQAGMLNRDNTYCIKRTESNTVVVGYVESGKLLLTHESKEMIIPSGCAFVISSEINYTIRSYEGNAPVMRWLNIRGAFAESALNALGLVPYTIAKVDIVNELELLTKWIGRNEDCFYEICGKVMTVFCRIGQNKMMWTVSEPDENNMSERFDAYLSNSIQTPFSVKKMADDFNISTDTLNRRFHKLFNKTPYRYYEEIRTDIAKSLLLQSDIPIKDIAGRLNYTDRNHFTVNFYKRTGEYPASFRKKHHDGL